MLLKPQGLVKVKFSGFDPVALKFHQGSILGNRTRIDDNEWHFVQVTRDVAQERVDLYVDFKREGSMHMPFGIDLEDQEQRIIVGGGNDRRFRNCQIDEVRICSEVRKPTWESSSKILSHKNAR